jgi:hypothetical protein
MRECPLGDNCPNWHLWMDEIGGLASYLDERIATLTEHIAYHQPRVDPKLEGLLEAYEDVRSML